jgi:hypothetical protein
LAKRPTAAQQRVTVVVIECDDKTCTVVGSNFAVSCRSLHEATRVVEDMTPRRVEWRETAPGFWVARTG